MKKPMLYYIEGVEQLLTPKCVNGILEHIPITNGINPTIFCKNCGVTLGKTEAKEVLKRNRIDEIPQSNYKTLFCGYEANPRIDKTPLASFKLKGCPFKTNSREILIRHRNRNHN